MSSLGGDEAEVFGRSGDALFGLFGAPRPKLTRRGDQLNSDVAGGRLLAPVHIAPAPSLNPDVGDVAEPVCWLDGCPEGVGDVLAVRPGLHQPSGGKAEGAHVRPEPRDPVLGPFGPEGVEHGGSLGSPPFENLCASLAFAGAEVLEAAAGGDPTVLELGERLGVEHGEAGRHVGLNEVNNGVLDVPPLGGGDRFPLFFGEVNEELVQGEVFGFEVVTDLLHTGIVGPAGGGLSSRSGPRTLMAVTQGASVEPMSSEPVPAAPRAEDLDGGEPPDTLNDVGVLKRREIEARIVAPLLARLAEEFGDERVYGLASEVIVDVARGQGTELAGVMGGNDLSAFADSMDNWKKGGALEIEVVTQTDDEFAFNVKRCRYAEMYQSLGLEELGATLSCNRDGTMVQGFNPDIEFTRTQTIMSGADHCDFVYRLPGSSSD